MPVTKLSMSFRPQIMAEIERRSEVELGNVSGVVNKALDRYFALLARARAELRSQLSDNECALILDATNGTMFANTFSISHLWAEIADACDMDQLDRKWQIDGGALVAKIQTSGMIGQAALIDASERWWRRVSQGENPGYGELLDAHQPQRYPNNEE